MRGDEREEEMFDRRSEDHDRFLSFKPSVWNALVGGGEPSHRAEVRWAKKERR